MKSFFSSLILVLALAACQKKSPENPVIPTNEYEKAAGFMFKQNDSAFYYFNRIAITSKDSFEVALAYNNMAVISADAGDYFGSQESLLQSLQYLDEDNPKHRSCLASDYNELGLSSMNLRDYQAALRYYDKALLFSDLRDLQLVIWNNKAVTYQRIRDYGEALKIYRKVLAESTKGGKEYARTLSNKAKAQWLADPRYKAAAELLTALRIRMQKKDLWGQNASFSHLADYYTTVKPDSALFYAEKRYEVARRINSPNDRIEGLRKLINLSAPHAAKQYFGLYQQLTDSVQTARNAAKNQYALIRYEAEKAKADNLELQKEVADKKHRIVLQNLMIWTIVILALAAAFAAVVWYRKRKQRLHIDAENRVKDMQLQTSKKVHDVVANGLYRIMTEIEHKDQLDKEQLLDKIDMLYEQSRDISYEKPKAAAGNFQQRIVALLTSFATDDVKILVAGNSEQLWKLVDPRTFYELEHILQELMVNMTKHSDASTVVVKFEKLDGNLLILYTDDGNGLPENYRHGNGMENTGNRIKDLNGSISFVNAERGLKIRISAPIE